MRQKTLLQPRSLLADSFVPHIPLFLEKNGREQPPFFILKTPFLLPSYKKVSLPSSLKKLKNN